MTQRAQQIIVVRLLAYCGADGALHFGPTVPHWALPVGKACPDVSRADEWKDLVAGLCRRSYSGTPLVPGVPEAVDQVEGLAALQKFGELIQPVIDKVFGAPPKPARRRKRK